MSRFVICVHFSVIYVALSLIDSYTTSFAISSSGSVFYELNPKVGDTSFTSIFFNQVKMLPLLLLFLSISFGYDLLPKRLLAMLGMGRMGSFDRFFMEIPGAASITVLFLMAIGCVNNVLVILQFGSIADFLLSFFFSEKEMKVAFFPIFTLLLFIVIIPISILIVSKIRCQWAES
ncbi:hypothetical protein [Alkalimonas mucilaginosa]|uniref:ABC transmembrane type-1 domain-containing protein n=1 Tax=Alkalimonas mucilaginosa TaxID=3057676 RepID=A0ABU7JKE0_9GAMM|nr:hypothetical protein [Alkalimonas sp. MEB004]MEE2025803.1 hypothetical protein [Alkalimonas sp. MEB004]